MISREEITCIGHFNKTHGINGEISATINSPLNVMDDCKCLVCNIDGIFVPFFPSNVRQKTSESMLITIDGITNETEAEMLVNKDIFVLTSDYAAKVKDDDEVPVDFFVGFDTLVNDELHGKVTNIDDSTANVLFVITLDNEKELLVPAADQFISEIDIDKRFINFDIPQDLLEL